MKNIRPMTIRAAEILNQKHGWGFTVRRALYWIERHRSADPLEQKAIEYMFDDANFHGLSAALTEGNYQGAKDYMEPQKEMVKS